jgi:quinolinate synthase
MVLWDGSCMVHEIFSLEKLVKLKMQHPQAKIIAHPECEEAILEHADFIGSTTALLNYSKKSSDKEFIVLTETGILHQMQKASPDKTFIPAPPNNSCACNDCPYMKLNTLEKIYIALKYEQPELLMDKDLIEKAKLPIQRMLELSAKFGL